MGHLPRCQLKEIHRRHLRSTARTWVASRPQRWGALMDTRVCARPGCGNPLLPGRKLEDVCSYACRGQLRVEAIKGQTALRCSKQQTEQGLTEP
jgi:hypothetical protein